MSVQSGRGLPEHTHHPFGIRAEPSCAIIRILTGGIMNESMYPSGPRTDNPADQERFYSRTWFVVLMLIVFPPVGIPLAWVFSKPGSKGGRIALTVLSACILAGALAGGSGAEKSGQSAETAQPPAAVEQEVPIDRTPAPQPNAAETPEEPAPVLESIDAAYTGSTEEGTVVTDADFEVTGTYSDGSAGNVADFTLDAEPTLAAGETTTVTIEAEGVSCSVDIACTTVTKDQFIEDCSTVTYEDLARNESDWTGENVCVYGQVIQVTEDAENTMYRVSISPTDYGGWDDPVIVLIDNADLEDRVLEDDIVTVYGVSTGLYTYTTVLGASQTVPSILASYIDIDG
ncbi:hypothetical protein Shel_26310 [Slackia heliotrinireducens DSM 20476]|uniref:Uncharacterized protein n=2 Tax=Slackia TaxID=84108 RepID=C7N3B0_SLAHD|nr:hypothetical protein Shel_26310 [Slackia heliotrinireducens DSM 20476]